MVVGRGEKVLSAAAQDVISKIASVIPARLRPYIAQPSVGAKLGSLTPTDIIDTDELRRAIRNDRKLRLRYRSDPSKSLDFIQWRSHSDIGPLFCQEQDRHRLFTDRIYDGVQIRRQKTWRSSGPSLTFRTLVYCGTWIPAENIKGRLSSRSNQEFGWLIARDRYRAVADGRPVRGKEHYKREGSRKIHARAAKSAEIAPISGLVDG